MLDGVDVCFDVRQQRRRKPAATDLLLRLGVADVDDELLVQEALLHVQLLQHALRCLLRLLQAARQLQRKLKLSQLGMNMQ